MKLQQIGRLALAGALSAAMVLGASACSEDYTIDYLYVTGIKAVSTSSPNGSISAYKIDNQSGSLTQMVDSPYSSGGRYPIAVLLSPNNQALYVLNHDDSTIVEFLIGTDGKIYPQNTYNLGPTFPVAGVIDPTNRYLIVLFAYQHGYTNASPGPGGIAIFAINGDNSLNSTPVANGALPYFPVGHSPIAIGVSPLAQYWHGSTLYTVGQTVWDGNNVEIVTTAGTSGGGTPSWNGTVGGTTADGSVAWKNVSPVYSYLYAVDQETAGGQVLGLLLSTASGTPTLTALPGTTATLTTDTGYAAGVTPFSIAEDPTGRFVYVTDQASNQVVGYVVQATGALATMVNSPFTTGLYPQGVTVDPRGQFVYVANYNAGTVSSYAINLATGTLSSVFTSGVSAVGTGPRWVTIEPSFGIYVYTANFIDNTVSGMQLDPHTGALENIQNTPFNSTGGPFYAVAAAAGSHSYQALQP